MKSQPSMIPGLPKIPTFCAILVAAASLLAAPGQQPQKVKVVSTQGSAPATAAAKPGEGQKGKTSKKDAKAPQKQEPKTSAQDDPKALLEPFLTSGLLGRLGVAPKLLALPEDKLASRLLPYLTGDRKRLILAVRNLVDGLGDVRYVVRERNQKTLEAMGPQILSILEEMKDGITDTEVRIRVLQTLHALSLMGDDDLQRKALYARGLAEALEYRLGKVETGALLFSLDNLDGRVRLASIRSLGRQLMDRERAETFGEKAIARIQPELASADLDKRNAGIVAIGSMPTKAAEDSLLRIYRAKGAPISAKLLVLRLLSERLDDAAYQDRVNKLAPKGLVKDAAAFLLAHKQRSEREALAPAGKTGEGAGKAPTNAAATEEKKDEQADKKDEAVASSESDSSKDEAGTLLQVKLEDGGLLEAEFFGLEGDRLILAAPEGMEALGKLRIPRASIEWIRPMDSSPKSGPALPQLLFKTGSRFSCTKLSLEQGHIHGMALGRNFVVPRDAVTCVLPNPNAKRAPGGSRNFDQLRLAGEKSESIEGTLTKLSDTGISFQRANGKAIDKTWKEVSGLLTKLKIQVGNADMGDLGQYVQIDLRDGQILVGYLLGIDKKHGIAVASHSIGCVELPFADIARVQMANSGRAQTGFTLIVEFAVSRVIEVDGEGREVWQLEPLFDPVDTELTANGNILVVEQADDAVREYDREGNVVWEYDKLEWPWDADRLPNGNTLITSTKDKRVIEVSPDKKIVWEYSAKDAKSPDFKPYEADRLPNGNTLICDREGKRILEISPAKTIVWQKRNVLYLWDADRLPNGNTLYVVGSPARVIEEDPQGNQVWVLSKGLQAVNDAERLPDGTTLVCDLSGVRIYNKEKKVLRRFKADQAYGATRY